MKRVVLPLFIVLCFYSESLFVDLLPLEMFGGERILVPHFTLVTLVLMGIYYLRNHTLLYAALFGLLFDVYYTEVIGIYLFLFPMSVYYTAKIIKFIQVNFLTVAFITLLNITIIEVVVYGLNLLILHVNTTPHDFAVIRLWPTLVLNIAFFILIFYPLSRWLLKRKKEVEEE